MTWWSESDILLETGLSPTGKAEARIELLRAELGRFAEAATALTDSAVQLGAALEAAADDYDRAASEAVIERGEDPALWSSFFE